MTNATSLEAFSGKLAGDLRALSHPIRLKIIQLIFRNGTINVNRIYHALEMEQSVTSQHLRILKQHDIVSYKREGKMIFYTLNEERIQEISQQLQEYLFN